MRKSISGVLFALVIMAAGGTSFAGTASAADIGAVNISPSVPQIQRVEYGGYSYCQRLRYRCNHKEELGQEGQGNCRRYHEECGQQSNCQRLRYRCYHKEELGQEGQGNCRRYHRECGGY